MILLQLPPSLLCFSALLSYNFPLLPSTHPPWHPAPETFQAPWFLLWLSSSVWMLYPQMTCVAKASSTLCSCKVEITWEAGANMELGIQEVYWGRDLYRMGERRESLHIWHRSDICWKGRSRQEDNVGWASDCSAALRNQLSVSAKRVREQRVPSRGVPCRTKLFWL